MLALLGAFHGNCLDNQLDLLLRNQEDLRIAAAAKSTQVLSCELHKIIIESHGGFKEIMLTSSMK